MMLLILISLVLCQLIFVQSGKISSGDVLKSYLQKTREFINQEIKKLGGVLSPSTDYPYWNFLPQYATTVKPDVNGQFSSPCFDSNTVSTSKSLDGMTYTISIRSSSPTTTDACTDDYAFITTSVHTFKAVKQKSSSDTYMTTLTTLSLPADITEAEQWDVDTNGIRVFRFLNDRITTLSNLLVTLDMFLPQFTQRVPPGVAEKNIDFMRKYPQYDIQKRDMSLAGAPPPAELVHSGDFFGIMRLDGLNPMLSWAMGSTTGHTTTALWIDGELNIVESDIQSAFWPKDNVQRTPYKQWLEQARAADYQVAWAPLSLKYRKMYNETAAYEYFKTVEGYEYGFKTLLWGWLDTLKDNFPCLPPDYSSNCLQWSLLEPVLALVDRKIPQIGDMIWNAGLNQRLGTADLRTADIFYEANKRGLTSNELITIVERDDWVYNTTRDGEPAVGPAMVCCVFVCNMWKAAGIFKDIKDQISCEEQTNFDDYSMNLFDDYKQIIGTYTIELNKYNSRKVYAHMDETCESLAPDYERTEGC